MTAERQTTDKRKRLEFTGFGSAEWQELYRRQDGQCAVSGDPLNESAEPHHVVPANHNGVRNEETNEFVQNYSQNCVLVNRECSLDQGQGLDDASPHLVAHGGNYRNGAAMTHADFKYSHGSDVAGHREWAAKNGAFVDEKIWPEQRDARVLKTAEVCAESSGQSKSECASRLREKSRQQKQDRKSSRSKKQKSVTQK